MNYALDQHRTSIIQSLSDELERQDRVVEMVVDPEEENELE